MNVSNNPIGTICSAREGDEIFHCDSGRRAGEVDSLEPRRLDLCRRIVARYKRGGITRRTCEGVGSRRSIEASARQLPRRSRISDDQLHLLVELVAEEPHRTLPELCNAWVARYVGELSASTLGGALGSPPTKRVFDRGFAGRHEC